MANLDKLPKAGEANWDVPLNATLLDLDGADTDLRSLVQQGFTDRPVTRQIPPGGGTGYTLGKASSTNFDVQWVPTSVATSPSERKTARATTTSIAAGATWTGVITMTRGYRLYKLSTSAGCRVRLYSTPAKRDADLNRARGVAPTGDHGLILDASTEGALSLDLTPQVQGANLEASPSDNIPISITNLSGATATVWADLVYVDTEIVTESTHASLKQDVHGVVGYVVGTSDVQTLTNKTINGPVINNPTLRNTDGSEFIAIEPKYVQFCKSVTLASFAALPVIRVGRRIVVNATFVVAGSDGTAFRIYLAGLPGPVGASSPLFSGAALLNGGAVDLLWAENLWFLSFGNTIHTGPIPAGTTLVVNFSYFDRA